MKNFLILFVISALLCINTTVAAYAFIAVFAALAFCLFVVIPICILIKLLK